MPHAIIGFHISSYIFYFSHSAAATPMGRHFAEQAYATNSVAGVRADLRAPRNADAAPDTLILGTAVVASRCACSIGSAIAYFYRPSVHRQSYHMMPDLLYSIYAKATPPLT